MRNNQQMRREMAGVSHERRLSRRVYERSAGEHHEADLHGTMRGGSVRRPDVRHASRRVLHTHGLPLQRADVAAGHWSTGGL